MSYILDALKKMEHEKARKVESPGMTRISGELFRDDHRGSPAGGVWKIVGVAIVASLVAIAGTWFSLGIGRGLRHPPASPPPFARQSAPFRPPAASLASLPPVAQPSPRPAAPPVPEGRFLKGAERSPLQHQGNNDPSSTSRQGEATRGEAPRAQLQERPAAAPLVAAPADIRVSGIAWQEERRGRRAVINGALMREGSQVSGARVAEIRPDRVRFTRSGSRFEIPLVAPADAGADSSAPPDR